MLPKFLPSRQFLILFTKTIQLTNICRSASNDLLTDKFTSRFQIVEKYRENEVCLIELSGEDLYARYFLMEIFILSSLREPLFPRGSIVDRDLRLLEKFTLA